MYKQSAEEKIRTATHSFAQDIAALIKLKVLEDLQSRFLVQKTLQAPRKTKRLSGKVLALKA